MNLIINDMMASSWESDKRSLAPPGDRTDRLDLKPLSLCCRCSIQ